MVLKTSRKAITTNTSALLGGKGTIRKFGFGTLTHLNFIYVVVVCDLLKNYLDLYKYQFTLLTWLSSSQAFYMEDCVSNGPEGEGLTMSLPYLHTSMALHCPIKFRLFNTAYEALDGWPSPACLSAPLLLQPCAPSDYSCVLENSTGYTSSVKSF